MERSAVPNYIFGNFHLPKLRRRNYNQNASCCGSIRFEETLPGLSHPEMISGYNSVHPTRAPGLPTFSAGTDCTSSAENRQPPPPLL
ncbi:hypothetical protein AVEN_11174-1 [Araneus ventricosus]|uniref:Uncharacterized protein n=1 Tax=Araneus ventricosus TaxID=182803 RepID=A0A4Y2TBV8_ARAVE|nr:hypothetical protein AVEN_11174-1 [Araneus ventricosus]